MWYPRWETQIRKKPANFNKFIFAEDFFEWIILWIVWRAHCVCVCSSSLLYEKEITSWITSWSLTAFRTLFLLVSWISPPRINSSKIKYAFSKLNMMSSSQTYGTTFDFFHCQSTFVLTLPKYLSSNST